MGIVAPTGLDTRSLVFLHLRERGAMRAVATTTLAEDEALAEVRARPAMQGAALVDRVSTARRMSTATRALSGSPSSTTAASARLLRAGSPEQART